MFGPFQIVAAPAGEAAPAKPRIAATHKTPFHRKTTMLIKNAMLEVGVCSRLNLMNCLKAGLLLRSFLCYYEQAYAAARSVSSSFFLYHDHSGSIFFGFSLFCDHGRHCGCVYDDRPHGQFEQQQLWRWR